MKRLALFLVTALATSPVAAQWQVPVNSIPIGQGFGVSGFKSIAPATAGQCLVANGPSAAPSFQACGTVSIGAPLAGGTANGVLYNNAGTFGNTNSSNNGVLVTSGVGAPSISSTLPSGIAATNMALTTPTLTTPAATGGTYSGGTFSGTAAWNGNIIGLLYGGTGANLSATGGVSQFLKQTTVGGAVTVAQPAFTDISGTVAPAQLPTPTATTLGGVQSAGPVANQWVKAIFTSGAPSLAQPAFTDLSGSASAAQMPALTGDVTSTAGTVATTIAPTSVTNAKLATMAPWTNKANATSGTATPTDITIGGLTQKVTPAGTDLVIIQDQTAAGALKYATVSSVGASSGVSSIAGNTGPFTLSNGLINSVNDLRINTGHIPGSNGTFDASAGEVGEYWSAALVYASRVTLSSGVAANVIALTNLTPGDWDVSGLVNFETTGSPIAVFNIGQLDFAGTDAPYGAPYTASATDVSAIVPPQRIKITVNTTINLQANTSWTGGTTPTVKAWGRIWARRYR